MKKTNLLATLPALILTAFMAACADDHATDNDQKQNPEKVGTVFIGTNTIKIADNHATRTSLDYTFGENDFNFFWEPNDFVWNRSNWDMFFTNITAKAKLAKFTSSNQYTDTEIPITYCGTNSGAPYAVIFSDLTQAEPNNTAHLGDGGDCGIGKAKRQPNGVYRFTLEHRSAYLCLLPRTPNGLTSTVITKVTITSDNAIIGYSYLQADGNLSTPTGGTGQDLKKQVITLGTGGQGFPLNNAQTSQATNAIYSVIYPGTHALKIEYTLKDTQTNVETTVTKTIPSLNYAPNTLTPITANLAVIPSLPKFYMWDAQQHYWLGYESEQPFIMQGSPGATRGQNFPQSNSDPRYYNPSFPGTGLRNDAQTPLFQTIPNVNELWWYIKKGDPHFDSRRGIVFAAYDGHLRMSGGVWLRKKNTILTYLKNTEHYPSTLTWNDLKEGYWDSPTDTPVDYRTTEVFFSSPINRGIPANIGDYFFLPVAGTYINGWFRNLGGMGTYWSSSGSTLYTGTAYALYFHSMRIGIDGSSRTAGFPARPFE